MAKEKEQYPYWYDQDYYRLANYKLRRRIEQARVRKKFLPKNIRIKIKFLVWAKEASPQDDEDIEDKEKMLVQMKQDFKDLKIAIPKMRQSVEKIINLEKDIEKELWKAHSYVADAIDRNYENPY